MKTNKNLPTQYWCESVVSIALLCKYSLAQLIPISPLKSVAHLPNRFFSYPLTLFNSPPLIFLFFYHCYYLFLFSFFLISLSYLLSPASFFFLFSFFFSVFFLSSFYSTTIYAFQTTISSHLHSLIFFSSLFSLDSYWLCSPYSKSMEI